MKRILTALCLSGYVAVAWAAAEVGKPAPDFTATDITGKTHRLSDYKGKIVVLESYNYNCPFVRKHYKPGAMQELQAELTQKGVVWFVVNSVHPGHGDHRTREAALKEWSELGIKATAWLDDSSGAIGKAYGMRTTPHMFVIDKDGILVYEGAIDDQPSSSGDPRKARNYVREVVNKLLAGEKPEVTQTRPYGCSVKYAD
jgi:peroxiredoxin